MHSSESSDVQTIAAALQEEIRRHQVASGTPESAISPETLDRLLRYQRVNPHLPIGWPEMPKSFTAKLGAYAKKIVRRLLRWYINPLIEQQNDYNAAVTQSISALQDHTRKLLVQLQQPLREQEMLRLRVQRMENWYRNSGYAEGNHLAPLATDTSAPTPSPDLFLLGAKYRPEKLVREQLHEYDDLFALVRAHQAREESALPVLDIGCGRGELVEHLTQMGISAYGIDIDRDAVQLGQAAGRDVRQAEAFAHLHDLRDGSLSAITMIQVIEHFKMRDLLGLLTLAARKLAPDGLLLAETINPLCVFALVHFYLLDPSHRTPLHPDLAHMLLEQAGLERIEIRPLHAVPQQDRLETLSEGGSVSPSDRLIQPFNHNVRRLNEFLYGSQDYAAIAHKPKE
ncbi:MAG: hypothetical protein A2Y73_07525 [Chloroflexi bacterium RBG_13_56_8]|nr:MAG: hypothetical protein A2Y73_07525 [Chloroflexi bacterium RBG_13_56_8]